MEDRTRVHVFVSGDVQGVNFRSWVRSRAEAHGLAGWAANLDDGSVEVVLQGAADAVAAVERAVGEGPSHAHVEAVAGEDDAVRDDLAGFERR